MRYLLDTNACIDYLNGRYPLVTRRLQEASPEDLGLSSIVVAELRYGADKSAQQERNHQRVNALVAEMETVDFDADAARIFGRVRSGLEAQGEVIGPYDMLIAAHALALGVVLVTDNVREFTRVAGLRIENWRQEDHSSS